MNSSDSKVSFKYDWRFFPGPLEMVSSLFWKICSFDEVWYLYHFSYYSAILSFDGNSIYRCHFQLSLLHPFRFYNGCLRFVGPSRVYIVVLRGFRLTEDYEMSGRPMHPSIWVRRKYWTDYLRMPKCFLVTKQLLSRWAVEKIWDQYSGIPLALNQFGVCQYEPS